jgi:N4-gp56 family major capsid protein
LANNFNDTVNLATVIGTSYDVNTLRPLRPKYIFDASAQEKKWNLNSIPSRGAVIQFPVLAALSSNTGSLVATGAGGSGSQKNTYTRRDVALELYGDHMITDMLEANAETFIDEVADGAFLMADQGMNSLNLLARTAMDLQKFSNETSGTYSNTYHYCASYGSGTQSTNGPLKAKDVRTIVSNLRAANVPTFEDGLYRWIIHPIQYTQLRSETDQAAWTQAAQYVDNSQLLQGDIGVFEGVRFIVNDQVYTDSSSTLSSYAFGRDFVGKAIGKDLRVATKSYLTGDHENQLTIYWDALVGYKIVRRASGYIVDTSLTKK